MQICKDIFTFLLGMVSKARTAKGETHFYDLVDRLYSRICNGVFSVGQSDGEELLRQLKKPPNSGIIWREKNFSAN